MIEMGTVRALLEHNDWADGRIVSAAGGLGEGALDRDLEIGMGTFRRTMIHLWAGEDVWVKRWRGESETPWPDEGERVGVEEIGRRLSATWAARERFLSGPVRVDDEVVYRDSRGSLFRATLGEMMLQMCLHSAHHRAQLVNMLRRLGAAAPELDYMMRVRRAV